MEPTRATLIELKNFLFLEDDDLTPLLQVYQPINEDAKSLLLEMEDYSKLIFFYNIEPRAVETLASRLRLEGLNFVRIITSSPEAYDATKKISAVQLSEQYNITCYIDETGCEVWKNLNLKRLRY